MVDCRLLGLACFPPVESVAWRVEYMVWLVEYMVWHVEYMAWHVEYMAWRDGRSTDAVYDDVSVVRELQMRTSMAR